MSEKNYTYMVEKYPNLLKYFASKNPGFHFVLISPLLGFFLYQSLSLNVSFLTVVGTLLAGVLWWSFLEYAIHRWAYHTHFKSKFMNYFLGSFHLYHHAKMEDRRVYNAGFLMVYLMAPLILSPFYLLTQSLALTSLFGLGVIGFYFFYECVHFLLHYKAYDSGYLNWIQRYHFYHHEKRPDKNFGNTSDLWDRLLGTFDSRYRDYNLSLKAKKTLITQDKESHGLTQS